ncbi:MAG: hypothetical protein ACOYM9_19540 [Bradymonadia bacterium]|jgi:hypothetical protein
MKRTLGIIALLAAGCGSSDDGSTADAGAGNGGGGRNPPLPAGATPRGEQVDCTFFDRPDGCWAEVLEAIRACRPSPVEGQPIDDQPEAFGTLDDTLRVCTYPNGTRITLQDPLPDIYTLGDLELVGAFGDYIYRFTMTDPSGAECLRFDQEEEPLVLHLAAGDFRYSFGNLLDPMNAFGQLVCPDGSEYWMPYTEFSTCAPSAIGGRQGSYHLHVPRLGFNDDQLTSWICFAPPP